MTQDDGSDDSSRKERVIHTRVPAVLERELKRLATSLRVPVSNVVRTILEDAVHTRDAVGRHAEGELRGAAERLRRSRLDLVARTHVAPEAEDEQAAPALAPSGEPAPAPQAASAPSPEEPLAPSPPAAESTADVLANVVGFQPLLLAKAGRCAACGCELPAGREAYLGIREDGGPRVVIGRECLPFG